MKNDLGLIVSTFLIVLGLYIYFLKAPSTYIELLGLFFSTLLIVFVLRMTPILKKNA